MNIQQLRYVTETVRCGSINEAAKRLYVSQPSLSNAVKELEKELGIVIFHRNPRGITLTAEGEEFLGYARQALEQLDLLESKYKSGKPVKRLCGISTQHYSFSVEAFVRLIRESGADEYEFTLRETRTSDIISDVRNLRSEVGVLYKSSFNSDVISRVLRENGLTFTPLFSARPHIFVWAENPLAKKACVTPAELEDYPCLSFEQGENNSFYYAEELLSTAYHKKSIRVSDRATLFNLLIGLNGYTISSGILSSELNGGSIVSVPLDADEVMTVGYVLNEKAPPNAMAQRYIFHLREVVREYSLSEPK